MSISVYVHISECFQTFGFEGTAPNYPDVNSLYFLRISKPIPVQAWIGPEGSRRLMLSDFMTIGT